MNATISSAEHALAIAYAISGSGAFVAEPTVPCPFGEAAAAFDVALAQDRSARIYVAVRENSPALPGQVDESAALLAALDRRPEQSETELRPVGATIATPDGHRLSVLRAANGEVYATLEWEPGEGRLIRVGQAPAAYVSGLLAQASGVTR